MMSREVAFKSDFGKHFTNDSFQLTQVDEYRKRKDKEREMFSKLNH